MPKTKCHQYSLYTKCTGKGEYTEAEVLFPRRLLQRALACSSSLNAMHLYLAIKNTTNFVYGIKCRLRAVPYYLDKNCTIFVYIYSGSFSGLKLWTLKD